MYTIEEKMQEMINKTELIRMRKMAELERQIQDLNKELKLLHERIENLEAIQGLNREYATLIKDTLLRRTTQNQIALILMSISIIVFWIAFIIENIK